MGEGAGNASGIILVVPARLFSPPCPAFYRRSFELSFLSRLPLENTITCAFRPLYGLPRWNVSPGHGCTLTMEFGQPHLHIIEPCTPTAQLSPRLRKYHERRHVYLHGDWHLWIYDCAWRVTHKGKRVGDSPPDHCIGRAAKELNGQCLTEVTVDAEARRCRFSFDLGGSLETTLYDADGEQWLLFEPSGRVLTYRSDGLCSHPPENTDPNSAVWVSPFATEEY